MKKIAASLLILGSFAIAACEQQDEAPEAPGAEVVGAAAGNPPVQGTNGSQSAEAIGEVHSGTGDITEVSGDRVTISHAPVESMDWPAMTMTFVAQSPELVRGLGVGEPVSFQFRQAGQDYVLTSISSAR